jgi:hypothetical protein
MLLVMVACGLFFRSWGLTGDIFSNFVDEPDSIGVMNPFESTASGYFEAAEVWIGIKSSDI